MKYYPAIFVLEPFHKEFLISLLIGKFLYCLLYTSDAADEL